MNIKDKNLYYIGGIVRDEILGKKSFDTDLTYVGDAIEFAKNIKDAEIIQINEPFGTVRIKYGGEEIDIASTRDETYPIKGHLPKVKNIGCDLKTDVLRRDFTINALAKSTYTGEIIDYISGLEDIKNKKLRILHNKSFIDDPTRIIRGLKFSVRFNFELDEHTKKLQKEYLANVNYDMSKKRLKKELMETFNLNSQKAFEIFCKERMYKLITKKDFKIPNVNFEKLINEYMPKNVWIIYAGQIPEIETLPLTKGEKNIVENYQNLLEKNFNSDYEIYKNFCAVPIESVIMFASQNCDAVIKYLKELCHIKLEITGKNLVEMGITPSDRFQECFDYILKQKLQTPKITLKEEKEIVKEFFQI